MNGSKAKKKSAASQFSIPGPGVDLVQVERVLDFMASHHLEEFEYSHGGLHIRLKRAIAGRAPAPAYLPAELPAHGASGNSAAGPSTEASAAGSGRRMKKLCGVERSSSSFSSNVLTSPET